MDKKQVSFVGFNPTMRYCPGLILLIVLEVEGHCPSSASLSYLQLGDLQYGTPMFQFTNQTCL